MEMLRAVPVVGQGTFPPDTSISGYSWELMLRLGPLWMFVSHFICWMCLEGGGRSWPPARQPLAPPGLPWES